MCLISVFDKKEAANTRTVLIDKQAKRDLDQDAMDLVGLVGDQVRRLGVHSRTRKAVAIFGHVGRQKHVSEFSRVAPSSTTEPSKRRVQRSLVQLVVEMSISVTETALSTMIFWTFVALRWMWKRANAHKILLTLLLASTIFNTFFYSRAAYDWWQERKARDYMVRLGVEADVVMSKAIYLNDVEEAIAGNNNLTVGNNSRDCFAIFSDQVLEGGRNDDFFLASPADTVAKKSARRFQQTREELGIYRHDLIVALRVLNTIDRELVQNEWEAWLHTELRRCRQVEDLLDENKMTSTQSVFAEEVDEIRRWHDSYCVSCQRAKSTGS